MSEDGKALQAYGLFLRGCCNAMEEVDSLCELNTPANMLTVIRRLPYKLRDKWRTVAYDIQEKHSRRAKFADIVGFIERQVKILTDPVFGNIQDVPKSLVHKEENGAKPSPLSRAKGSSFATPVERKTMSENTVVDGHSPERTCLYCKGGHMLELCALLEKRAHSEKIDFLKTNGVCFGCLCTGHISKDCRKRLSCETCGLRHPSMLHIHPEERGACPDKGKSNFECTVDSSLVAVQTSGLTGAGEQNCKLAIVPVKVKSTKGQRTVETYAFLDQGSSASFCTTGLMDKLNLSGRKTKILLRTMGQEKIVDSCIVSDLEVAGLDSGSYCQMPDIFTQPRMPVNRSNIPRQQHLHKWPHLKQIHLPEIDADVELLIGMNVPRALEPLKVIRSVDKGPYAIKTMLGWTVNGPLGGECCDGAVSHPAVTINRISAVTLDELWKQQFKGDLPECSQDVQTGPSREDCKFLETANKTVKLLDCHASIALPLKNRDEHA